MSFFIKENTDGLLIKVHVQPRSSKNKIAGLYGDALKINIMAPPVDNAANKACGAFLARLLSVPKASVTILSGHTGRNKQVMINCPEEGGRRDSIKKVIMAWVKN